MKHVLSKSTYVRSLQCLKSLYLYKYNYSSRDIPSKELLQKFKRGHDIGAMAHQLFPGGVNASLNAGFKSKQAAMHTYELLHAGNSIIYEASFVFNEVWVIADILVRDGYEWKIYEVKSTIEISDTFMHDAALQYYVISNAASEIFKSRVTDFSIIHVNKAYRKHGHIRWSEFFITKSVMDKCINMTDYVVTKIDKAKQIINERKMPAIPMGEQCMEPYPCDFQGFCRNGNFVKPIAKTTLEAPPPSYTIVDVLFAQPAIPLFDNNFPFQYLPFSISVVDKEGTLSTTLLLHQMGSTAQAWQIISKLLKESTSIISCNASQLERLVQQLKTENEKIPLQSAEHSSSIYSLQRYTHAIPRVEGNITSDIDAVEAFLQYIRCSDIFMQNEIENTIHQFALARAAALKEIMLASQSQITR